METDELDVLDILAYNSDALLTEFSALIDDPSRAKLIEEFLKKHLDNGLKEIGDFPKDLDWFNVSKPIRMGDLSGKLVVLDFFTYCCINCMHILPDLKSIEKAYPIEKGLVVIGVHSAKFENEKDSANLLSAIQRYNITHPIVNDFDSTLWSQLKIKCWPTLFIISPTGIPLLVLMGEGHGLFLNQFIEVAISFFRGRKQLAANPLPLSPSTDLKSASNLRFPSKICRRLKSPGKEEVFALSDSGNNRILVFNSQGQVLEKIGGFESGFVDGDFNTAKFSSPQGLTFLSDDLLIVADTENHAIRQVNLRSKVVSTIAGTGKQGSDKVGGLSGTQQELSSPWDVAAFKARDMDMSFHLDEKSVPEKSVILIAMAGTHQIWGLFLDGVIWWKFKKYEPLTCAAIIGNGSEENRNNSYPQNAAFAQPSGLTAHNDMLFIADSESSSVRRASMIDGKVTAVVGGDRNPLNLFAFGDTDGKQFSAKLQHPLGVVYNPSDEYLYVSDTYNHKVKRVDPKTNVIETCFIRDKNRADLIEFSEPDGLCVDSTGKLLYVADTNNHTIRVVDIENMIAWPLVLKFNAPSSNEFDGKHVETLEKQIKVGPKGRLVLNTSLLCADGLKLTEAAPQKWSLQLPSRGFHAEQTAGQISGGMFSVALDVDMNNASESDLQLTYRLNTCTGNVCMHTEFRIHIRCIQDAVERERDVQEELKISIKPGNVSLL